MFLKKLSVLFLIISLSFLSTSLTVAGLQSASVNTVTEEAEEGINKEMWRKSIGEREEESIQERILRVNSRDYGRYDPAPTLSRPRFKLIPN